MARLRRNLVKRGNVYYHRLQIDGRDTWRSLKTTDYDTALLRYEREKGRGRAATGDAPQKISRATVAQFSKAWIGEYVTQRRSAVNVKLAQQRLRDHVLPSIGKLYLDEVTVPVLRRMRQAMDATLSAQSVRHVLSDVRCLLRYATESGLIRETPRVAQVFPKLPELAPRRLTDAQVEAILAAAQPTHRLIIRFLLLTGLRWSEFTRLAWSQVVELPAPHLVLERTKSGRVRRVPLVPEAIDVLEQLKAARAGNRSGKVRRVQVSPIQSKNAAHMAQRYGMGWHVHQLRHTFAARFLEAGGSASALQEILGHRSPITTQRYSGGRDAAIFREVAGLKLTSGFTPEVVANPVAVAVNGAPPVKSNAFEENR